MRRRQHVRRQGTTVVEGTIVLFVFMILVLGALDLGIANFRSHLLCQAARHGARQAIVHGSKAPASMGSWGPATIDTLATSSATPLVAAVQPYLIGFDLSQTHVKAEWLQNSNDPDDPNQVPPAPQVKVTVSSPYQPVLTLGRATLTLQATSTMSIAH